MKKDLWQPNNPTILSPLLKRCQTLCVHPCGEEEEVMSTPKGNGGHQWPAWLPTTPGKSRMESMCLDPHTIAKKKKKRKKKEGKKITKVTHCVGRGEYEVLGWAGVGVKGSGWWWVPDWGTSGDFWGGRAMHHVSCYQPLFPHLIVKPWIMHGRWDWRRGKDGGVGRGTSTLKGPCHSGSHYRWTTTLMSHGDRES